MITAPAGISIEYVGNIPVIHNLPAGTKVLYMGITGEPLLILVIGTPLEVKHVYIIHGWYNLVEAEVQSYSFGAKSLVIRTDKGYIEIKGGISYFQHNNMLAQDFRVAAPVVPDTEKSPVAAPMDGETLNMVIYHVMPPLPELVDEVAQAIIDLGGVMISEEPDESSLNTGIPFMGGCDGDVEMVPVTRRIYLMPDGFFLDQLYPKTRRDDLLDSGICLH